MSQTGLLGKVATKTAKQKINRFNFGRDINTTGSIGDVNPLTVTQVIPGSHWSMGLRDYIRMTPLVSPTFGRLFYDVTHQFVALSDLSKVVAAMFAQTSKAAVNGGEFDPESVPNLPLGLLSSIVLIGAKLGVVVVTEGQGQDTYEMRRYLDSEYLTVVPESRDIWNKIQNYIGFGVDVPSFDYTGNTVELRLLLGGYWNTVVTGDFRIPIGNNGNSPASFFMDTEDRPNGLKFSAPVTPEGADYIIDLGNVQGQHLAFTARLSSFGKRLRKILIGCGYQVDFSSRQTVSLMPLFAWYKAYYDRYAIQYKSNYDVTNMAKLLNAFDQNMLNADFTNMAFSTSLVAQYTQLFWSWIKDLGSCWYTMEQDWVSAHISELANSPAPNMAQRFIDVDSSGLPEGLENQVTDTRENEHVHISNIWHGNLSSEYLKRVYRWINRNTIAGKRVAELLRQQGLGGYVDSCHSNFIGHTSEEIDIFDVMSNSDTLAGSGDEGKLLGDYAGVGIGKTGKDDYREFKYSAEEFGFVISMYSVIPSAGYCQGLASHTLCVRKNDFFNPEYDSVGMTLTRKNQIVASQDMPKAGGRSNLEEAFGFIPMYSHFKYVQNVLNGDFSLRGSRDAYLPFTLDRYIQMGVRSIDSEQINENRTDYHARDQLTPDRLPTAGDTWRFIGRYQWLGLFNRIFAQRGRSDPLGYFIRGLYFSDSEITENLYDNLIIHNHLDMDYWAPMKALEDSFETDDDGKTDISISKA